MTYKNKPTQKKRKSEKITFVSAKIWLNKLKEAIVQIIT